MSGVMRHSQNWACARGRVHRLWSRRPAKKMNGCERAYACSCPVSVSGLMTVHVST